MVCPSGSDNVADSIPFPFARPFCSLSIPLCLLLNYAHSVPTVFSSMLGTPNLIPMLLTVYGIGA